jgi:hypothetical protein
MQMIIPQTPFTVSTATFASGAISARLQQIGLIKGELRQSADSEAVTDGDIRFIHDGTRRRMIFHAFYTNPNPNPMKNHRSV